MMKHLNKYLSLALALVLCLSLAACGESNEDYPLMIDLVAALYQFLIYSSHTVAAFML